uniref:Uncharacterized protein n=1 Tax=Candidatus Kentrum sp. FM TaxID=2126340 RepID=A0A450STH1_9GAMM|nr:MAG: hypothetical protein BECKFM1743C_GA0114222_101986 [Candidatus Kentron sp. FM]VFJ57639.1 MAG: hypothetical protein BECKFM1743A_GA0114220_101956 [Candidatus Kentron sp. FM]
MDKKSPFLARFLARMSVFERENTTFLLVFHPVSADVIFWECTRSRCFPGIMVVVVGSPAGWARIRSIFRSMPAYPDKACFQ